MKHLLIISFLFTTAAMVGQTQTKRAAFLVSDGTLPLDYVGAYEVLGQARMKVFTVAKTMNTLTLATNMLVVPNYSIDNAPEFDILVIPSSFDGDTAVISWIRRRAKSAEHILTICGGVTPVYDAGLLDGKTITSYGPLIDHIKRHATNATVVTDKRLVDNGKIITCGSFAAGIDGALYLVSKIYGIPRAQEVANNIEYNWDKEYKYVRSKLADNWLAPFVDFWPPLNGRVHKYEGDETQWVAEYEVQRKESFQEFYSQIPEMADMHHWMKIRSSESDTMYSAAWTRRDLDHREWTCISTIRQIQKNTYLLLYEIRLRK